MTGCKNLSADFDKVQNWTSSAYNAIVSFDEGKIPEFVAKWTEVKAQWDDIVTYIAPYESALKVFGLSVVSDTFDYIDSLIELVFELPDSYMPVFKRILDKTQSFFYIFTSDLAPLMRGTFNPDLFGVHD